MDAYLDIAKKVLETTRKPMSARQLLDAAYLMKIVPHHLHGQTQHKTLQARISEDILYRRHRSEFIRTEPGRFFLRTLLSDPRIPESFKAEFPAPRRAEQLKNFLVLCSSRLHSTLKPTPTLSRIEQIAELSSLNADDLNYQLLSEISTRADIAYFKTFTVVLKDNFVLVGRSYARAENDELDSVKSVGFYAYVTVDDRTLFSRDSFGFAEAAKRSLIEQINLTDDLAIDLDKSHRLHDFGIVDGNWGFPFIAALFVYACHPEFDPVERNPFNRHFYWHDIRQSVNNSADFDWCSELLLNSGYLRSFSENAQNAKRSIY